MTVPSDAVQLDTKHVNGDVAKQPTTPEENALLEKKQEAEADDDNDKSSSGCNVTSALSSLWLGWKVYAQQKVVLAGVSLGLLYMTVLGFDGVTTGKMYMSMYMYMYV